MTRLDEGEPALSPQNFPLQTLSAIWDNLPKIVAGAVWLNLCMLPALILGVLGMGALAAVAGVLLVAPGWVALQHLELGLAQGNVVPLASLLSSFRDFWTRSVRLGALAVALPLCTWLAAAWLSGEGGAAGQPGAGGSALAAPVVTLMVAASLLVASLLALYAVPLLVLYEHELPLLLRNCVVLSARHISNTAGMISLAVLFVLATLYLASGLIFVLPALYGMFVANNCRLVVKLEEAN